MGKALFVSDGSDQTTELPPPGAPAPGPADAYTSPLPAQQQPSLPTQPIALIFCAVAAASFLLGIALATATRERSDQTVVVSEDVGPDGKNIAFDGGSIDIPRGAVTDEVRIVVRRAPVTDRIRVESPADTSDVVQPGRLLGYSFEPTTLEFREPVEITFRLPEGVRDATVFARRGTTVVLLTGTIDVNDNTATAVVRDFRFEGRER